MPTLCSRFKGFGTSTRAPARSSRKSNRLASSSAARSLRATLRSWLRLRYPSLSLLPNISSHRARRRATSSLEGSVRLRHLYEEHEKISSSRDARGTSNMAISSSSLVIECTENSRTSLLAASHRCGVRALVRYFTLHPSVAYKRTHMCFCEPVKRVFTFFPRSLSFSSSLLY